MSVQRVRRLDLPWVSIAIFGAWGAMVAVFHLATQHGMDAPSLCHFKSLTGVPCPTCGGTRAAFSLAHLHPLEALAYNPLLTVLMVVGCGYLLVRTLTGRGVRVEWTRRGRAGGVALLVIAVLANWAWVIVRLG